MGLDIYLNTFASIEQNAKHEVEWEALYAQKETGEISDERYDELRASITPYCSNEDVPSVAHPDHLFNRRYLRSSYNDSGFNRAVPDFLGAVSASSEVAVVVDAHPEEAASSDPRGSLYWIFEPMERVWDGDDGVLSPVDIPGLVASKKRAEEVASELRNSDRLRVMTISPNQLSQEWLGIDGSNALSLAREAAARPSSEGWWSSRDVNWFGGTLKVLAMIPGSEKRFFADGPWPCVHVVYKAEDEGFESYVSSAEIVAEFCDEAITLIERDGGASMSWSG